MEGRFQKFPGAFCGSTALEYGAPCDQDLRARAHDVPYGVVMHTAVYFNPKLEAARLSDFHEQFHLFEGGVDESLAPKSRVHAHYKDVMNQRKDFVDGVDRRARVYHDAGFASV